METNDILTFLNEAYSYPNNKMILFGNERVAYRHIRGGTPLLRLVCLGAILIYLKWQKLSRKERLAFGSKHYLRVESLFTILYGSECFDYHAAIYILFEGRKDVVDCKEKSFFYGLIDEKAPCEYGKVYRVIDEWNSTTDHIIKSYSEGYVNGLLHDLVASLLVLKEYEAIIDDGLYFKKENEILRNDVVLKYSNYDYLILNKVYEGATKAVYDYLSLQDYRKEVVEEKRA